MAKKGKSKKEKEEEIEKDENLSEGTQDDISEADDSFGLPDIDYKPLDEIEEEPEPEPEPEPESAEVSEEPESDFEEDFSEELADQEDAESPAEPEVQETEAAANRPRRFEHPEKSSSAPKIIIGILLAIIVIAAGYYFGFYKPQQAEKARIEQQEQERQAAEEARLKREQEERERLAREQEEAAAMEGADEMATESGTVTAITERTGRYYVIIGAFIDDDLANDLAEKLAEEGTSTMLLPPLKEKGFYRLALSDYGTWAEAQSVADQMKGEFGDKVWVLKY